MLLALGWLSAHAQADYIVVNSGSTVNLAAQPDTYPEYVWFYNGKVIPNESTAYLAATQEGFYTVFALNEGGCPSDFSDEFQIIFGFPPPTGPSDQIFCANSQKTISDIVVNGENIKWYSTPTGGTPLSPNHLLTSGIYYASQTINGIESPDRFMVTITMVDCSDLLFISKKSNNNFPDVGDLITFTIEVHNNSSIPVTDIVVEEKMPSGYAYISSIASAGIYNPVSGIWVIPEIQSMQSVTLEITVEVLEGGIYKNIVCVISSVPDDPDQDDCAEAETFPTCLLVYNEFTPNGDGENDFFKIRCIDDFPNNTLRIYNRWGHLVYEKKSYQNEWKGIANRGEVMFQEDKKLPTGTYFYSLDLGTGRKPLVGWLYLMQE